MNTYTKHTHKHTSTHTHTRRCCQCFCTTNLELSKYYIWGQYTFLDECRLFTLHTETWSILTLYTVGCSTVQLKGSRLHKWRAAARCVQSRITSTPVDFTSGQQHLSQVSSYRSNVNRTLEFLKYLKYANTCSGPLLF